MKSIKSKIQISMLSVVLISAVLIGVITALLNASGIDDVMTKTLGPATQMAADAVEWKMGNYWTALQEAAASDIFKESDPTAPELIPIREEIAQRNGFHYTGKWMPPVSRPQDTAAPITGGLEAIGHQQAAPGIYRGIACHYYQRL